MGNVLALAIFGPAFRVGTGQLVPPAVEVAPGPPAAIPALEGGRQLFRDKVGKFPDPMA